MSAEEDDFLKELLGESFGMDIKDHFDRMDASMEAAAVELGIPLRDIYQTMHDLMMILQTLDAEQVEEYHYGVGFIAAATGVMGQRVRDGMVDKYFPNEKSVDFARIDGQMAYSMSVAYLNLFLAHRVRQRALKEAFKVHGMEEE